MLKGQDIVVLLALLGREGEPKADLARRLGWDAAGIHRSMQRLADSRLYERARARVSVSRTEEFLVHGVPYVFPVHTGSETRGVLTAWGAEPLRGQVAGVDVLPPVWPDPLGTNRGLAFEPLHRIAIVGATRDPLLYSRLALVDAIRGGDARSRAIAARLLADLLRP